MSEKNKNILIGGLISIVLIMAVGYGAFATQLNINGTASVTSTWDVHIKSITAGTPVGSAVNKSAVVGGSKLTASFETELVAPGDSLTYTVEIENSGSLDAKLSDLTFTPGVSAVIDYTHSGIAVNDVVKAGTTKTLTITVTYKSSAAGNLTEADKTGKMNMVLSFLQTNS